uniref:Immunoglobulin V-set domain-containing protein n=1 Tax=Cyprinus carpio TaxID=7962 RepID=A0A8C1VJ66_CYPCA
TGVHCVELTQTDSLVLSPGQVLTLSCKLSGYSVTDSSYCTGFNRQPGGKALEWVGYICGYDYSESFKDNSKSMVYLKLSGLTAEDSYYLFEAMYYCARDSL